MASRWPKVTPRWPKMDYDGFKMASRCPRIGHWGHLGPPWGHLGASSGPTWRHFGPTWGRAALHKQKYQFSIGFLMVLRSVLGHVGVMSGPFWLILEPSWAILGPFWAISGYLGPDTDWQYLSHRCRDPSRAPLGAISSHLGAISGAKMFRDSPKMVLRWPQMGLRWSPDVPEMVSRWTKMAATWETAYTDPFSIGVAFLKVLL